MTFPVRVRFVCGLGGIALFLAGVVAHAQGTPALSPHELATRIQARYDTTRDFSADFVQSYAGGVLKTRTSERGRVVIKKPGRMRWQYASPEDKLFVSDGRNMHYYVPADRQVVVTRVPDTDQATTAVLFLVGKGNLARDFNAEHTSVEAAPAGTIALRLSPKRADLEYEWLTVVVDERSYALRMLLVGDAQGGTSTFAFTNIRENTNPADSTFTFKTPRGADVVERP